MNELIDVIRTAVANGATAEQKAAGVLACRTIATALDTEPGKLLTLPGLSPPPATSRVSLDQVLDLAIARLSVIATQQEAKQTAAKPTVTAAASTQPRGFRMPVAPSSNLKRLSQPVAPGQRVRRSTGHTP